MNEMDQFVMMSRYAGEREDLVQAGGGNSSVKITNKKMVIKSSGVQMAEIKTDFGYSTVDYEFILNSLRNNDESENELIKLCTIEGRKPSIETFLHSMTLKYTLHTHPVLVSAIATRTTWKQELSELFPDAFLIDYKKPGLELALEMFKRTQGSTTNIKLVFLQNHGLIVSGENAHDVIDNTNAVIERLAKYVGISVDQLRKEEKFREEFHSFGFNNDNVLYKCSDFSIKKYMESFSHNDDIDIGFCPDCIVYAGYKACVIHDNVKSGLVNFYQRYGTPTVIIFDEDIYISAETIKKAKEIESIISFGIKVIHINADLRINYLSDEEKSLLLNWDAEKYRRGL